MANGLSEYNTPTRVIFGRGAEEKAGGLLAVRGAKKALVHYGMKSAEKSGVLKKVTDSLDAAGVSYETLGGVQANPVLPLVYEGIDIGRKKGVDFILAIGGGSAIDSAKAISYGLSHDFDVWKLFSGEEAPSASLPVGAVLTIAAAGSEMSNSCVITNEDGKQKRPVNNEFGRCVFALLNPELTMSLPEYQTMCGCVDIMMHTIERYFTDNGHMDITDAIAEELLRNVINNAGILLHDPNNYHARAEVMWAGSLSHNGLTGFGGGTGDFATHRMEMDFTALTDIAHGAGLAALWPSWARYVMDANPARFAKFAANVFDIGEPDVKKAALMGIEAMENFFRSINMPATIGETGVEMTDELAIELARRSSFDGKIELGTFKKLGRADMEKIFKMAK